MGSGINFLFVVTNAVSLKISTSAVL